MHEQIIKKIKEATENDNSVHAFWLEGSLATGFKDELSDLDVWLDVDDGKENLTFKEIENSLSEIGELDIKFNWNHPHPEIEHHIYHIKGTPETLTLDVNIQSHSREFAFTEGVKDQDIRVIFDKGKTIKFEKLDLEKLNKELRDRAKYLINIHEAERGSVYRQILRGKFLEAYGYYFRYYLEPLVELLRIIYEPTKTDYYIKHIYRDLPENITDKLEYLFKVSSVEEIETKIRVTEEMIEVCRKKLL